MFEGELLGTSEEVGIVIVEVFAEADIAGSEEVVVLFVGAVGAVGELERKADSLLRGVEEADAGVEEGQGVRAERGGFETDICVAEIVEVEETVVGVSDNRGSPGLTVKDRERAADGVGGRTDGAVVNKEIVRCSESGGVGDDEGVPGGDGSREAIVGSVQTERDVAVGVDIDIADVIGEEGDAFSAALLVDGFGLANGDEDAEEVGVEGGVDIEMDERAASEVVSAALEE